MSSFILGLLSLAIMIGGVLVASLLFREVRREMREGERGELKKQFQILHFQSSFEQQLQQKFSFYVISVQIYRISLLE